MSVNSAVLAVCSLITRHFPDELWNGVDDSRRPPAKISIVSTAATHSQCRSWVISGQTISG